MWRYSLLLRLLTLPIMAYTAWQGHRQHAHGYFRQRMGLYAQGGKAVDLWLHAASIGEVNALLPLVHLLKQQWPEKHILISTTTPTGGQVVQRQFGEDVSHAYLPIDWPGAVTRFIEHFCPSSAIIMETELWPNLYAACHQRQIPIVIINGRLSTKTLNAPNWLRELYADCLGRTTAILARSQADKDNFIQLRASEEKLQVIGNIKFAHLPGKTVKTKIELNRPYVLAASTRENEEQKVVEAWLSSDRENRLLVIAPRHPKRLKEIQQQLAPMCKNMAIRSRGDKITENTDIYLADTFGELPALMAGAEFIFMGGSLVAKGGHNILEPAQLAKAIIFGPYMENFADEAALLLAHEGALQVDSIESLTRCFNQLLTNADRCNQLGENAAQLCQQHSDMAERYLQAIKQIYPSPGNTQEASS